MNISITALGPTAEMTSVQGYLVFRTFGCSGLGDAVPAVMCRIDLGV